MKEHSLPNSRESNYKRAQYFYKGSQPHAYIYRSYTTTQHFGFLHPWLSYKKRKTFKYKLVARVFLRNFPNLPYPSVHQNSSGAIPSCGASVFLGTQGKTLSTL